MLPSTAKSQYQLRTWDVDQQARSPPEIRTPQRHRRTHRALHQRSQACHFHRSDTNASSSGKTEQAWRSRSPVMLSDDRSAMVVKTPLESRKRRRYHLDLVRSDSAGVAS